jgi:DNA-binding beta-propeller fold protein YncE
MSSLRSFGVILGLLTAAALPAAAPAAGSTFSFVMAWGSPGTSPGALRGPDNIAADLRGDVYVADRDNNRVQEFSSRGAFIRALGRNGGDGTAGIGNGEFKAPRGVTTDALGDVYVADSANNRIQKFGPDGRFLARFGRNGGDGSASRARGEFSDPRGLATDRAGDLWVADHANNRVQKLAPDGRFLAVIGHNGGEGSAGVGPAEFRRPRGVAVDRAGNLFVADKDNHRIQVFDPAGNFVRMWGRHGGDGTAGKANGEFNTPYSVNVDPNGTVTVADTFNHRIQRFSSQGVFLGVVGRNGGDGSAGAGPGEFRTPYGVASDCRANLYVTDEGNERIELFGDPASSPVCPPTLRLLSLPRRIPGRTLTVRAICDQPCTATVRARVRLGRVFIGDLAATSRRLGADRASTIRLRLTRAAARRLHTALRAGRHPVVTMHAEATGFAGAAAPQDRIRQLRG